jgi:integrase
MGTSVQMIEDHYGHINPVKNAERILQGLPGWEPIAAAPRVIAETSRTHAETAKDQAVKSKATSRRPYSKSSRDKGKCRDKGK